MTTPENKSDKIGWVEAAMRHNAIESLAEVGRIASAIYRSAIGEGLSPTEAKDVTEATLVMMMRSAKDNQTPGE